MKNLSPVGANPVLGSILIVLGPWWPLRPVSASILAHAARIDVRSVSTFCDLLLAGEPASAEILAHAEFFRVVRGAIPRMDGPDPSPRASNFAFMQNLAGRHGGRIAFTELVAGLDQVTQIAERTLEALNPADDARVRRAFENAFGRQPEIFEFISTRHEALAPIVRHELDIWIGRGFALEVGRLASASPVNGLNGVMHPDLAAAIDPVDSPARLDPQLARGAHDRLGRAVLAIFGLWSDASLRPRAREEDVADLEHLRRIGPQSLEGL